jgi:hypothetical protein
MGEGFSLAIRFSVRICGITNRAKTDSARVVDAHSRRRYVQHARFRRFQARVRR